MPGLTRFLTQLGTSIGALPGSRALEPVPGEPAARAPQVDLCGKLDRMQAVLVDRGRVYAVEERSVYVSDDAGRTFRPLGYLPRSPAGEGGLRDGLKTLVAKNGVTRSRRRSRGAASLAVLGSGTVVVVSDHVYRKAPGDDDFEIVAADLDFLPPFESGRSIAVGPDDTLYFGEYTTGPYPPTMRIFRGTDDGRSWSVAHTLPDGLVYHVHAVHWDPYRRCFWVCTGDADGECHIFRTDDDFASLERLGGGSQDWRAVALLVREDRLVWGSDDGRARSSVFAWDFAQGHLERLQDIGNPASYVGSLPDGTLLVATGYVPETAYGRSGDAVPEAALWGSPDGSTWTKLFALPADPATLGTARPQLRLPGGDESLPFAFVSPLRTARHDLSILKMEIDWSRAP